MLGAVLITVFTTRLLWSVRGPASDVPLDDAPQPAAATPLTEGTAARGVPES